jgi:predicted DNA-binding protein (UPF0251 family)
MPRRKIPRRLQFNPGVYYFKPRGVPLRFLEEIKIEADELEALKLYEVDGFDQVTAAGRMKVSQPTFARILSGAHKKIAEAIVFGKAIRIQTP